MILKLPIVILLSLATSAQGFAFTSTSSSTTSTGVNLNLNVNQVPQIASASSPFGLHQAQQQHRNNIVLRQAEGSTEDEKVEEVQAELTDEEPKSSEEETAETESSSSSSDEEEEEDAPTEPEEDPEITALKTQISTLENTLKQKNRDLNTLTKTCDEYTKNGYARKVAEMESFRRSKSLASSDNKKVAVANVLQSFLPILEQLSVLDVQYEDNVFAKSYKALRWDFNNALVDLGVVEYTVKEGDVADKRRVVAVQEEYSETVPQGVVISPVGVGFELEGNVMKLAQAVVSLGPEPAEEEEAEGGEEDVVAEGEGDEKEEEGDDEESS